MVNKKEYIYEQKLNDRIKKATEQCKVAKDT